jgi:hypothetical protein
MRHALLVIALVGCARRPAGPTIHAIDFRNFTYVLPSDVEGEPPARVRVVDGVHHEPERDGFAGEVDVRQVTYGDVDGDGRDDAIVILVDFVGAPSQHRDDEALVFALRDGAPAVIARVPGGDREDGGLVEVTAEPGGVRVEREVHDDRCAPCDSPPTAVEHWRWDGGALVRR